MFLKKPFLKLFFYFKICLGLLRWSYIYIIVEIFSTNSHAQIPSSAFYLDNTQLNPDGLSYMEESEVSQVV